MPGIRGVLDLLQGKTRPNLREFFSAACGEGKASPSEGFPDMPAFRDGVRRNESQIWVPKTVSRWPASCPRTTSGLGLLGVHAFALASRFEPFGVSKP